MMKGVFTISLDFELHWGGFEKWPLENYKQYFLRTREVIPQILKAFDRSGIHCTWATVGLLLNTDKGEVRDNYPSQPPTYLNENLSAYNFIEKTGIGDNEISDPFHYAASLVEMINATPNQELASHSYAHYYCNEPGQTPTQFLADMRSWNKAATKFDKKAVSLVFPRNQFNNSYLKMCSEAGIKIVRTNPTDWWWKIDSTQNESRWKRLNRGIDAYFNIGGKTSFFLNQVEKSEGVYLLPASRLLRPYNPKELFLNGKKISRIKDEMTIAAKNGECYHLWWHPHNFGNFVPQNLNGLIEVLNHFQYLHKKQGMVSLNMMEIAKLLDSDGEN